MINRIPRVDAKQTAGEAIMTWTTEQLAGLVEPDRAHRKAYTDPEIFDLEMDTTRINGVKASLHDGTPRSTCSGRVCSSSPTQQH